jgi:hypothetical protein
LTKDGNNHPNKALHPATYSFGFRSFLASAYAFGGG